MLVEFTPGHEDDTITAALEGIQSRMRNYDTSLQYVTEIQNAYSLYPEGNTELHRLARAAQVITGLGIDDFKSQTQAVYCGELLAMEVINCLEPGVGVPLKTGFAQSFIARMIEANNKRVDKIQHDQKISYQESAQDQQMRLVNQGQGLQVFFASEKAIKGMHPAYEKFATQAVRTLVEDEEHQALALAGFRMIMIESTKTWSIEVDEKTVEDANYLLENGSNDTRTAMAQQALINMYEQDFEETIPESNEKSREWEDVENLPRNIMNLFASHEASLEDTDDKSVNDIFQIESNIESALQEYNTKYELFTEDDYVAVSGNMFIIEYNEAGEGVLSLMSTAAEIRGKFENIYLTEVPTKRQLRDTMASPEHSEDILQDGKILTPVMRIIQPVRITTLPDDEVLVEEYDFEQIIDIPLNYQDISYRRIQLDDLEEES